MRPEQEEATAQSVSLELLQMQRLLQAEIQAQGKQPAQPLPQVHHLHLILLLPHLRLLLSPEATLAPPVLRETSPQETRPPEQMVLPNQQRQSQIWLSVPNLDSQHDQLRR